MMAPTSGRQHTDPGSMDPDWQTHESGSSGEHVLRGRSELTPMHHAPNTGHGVHRSELGSAPDALSGDI